MNIWYAITIIGEPEFWAAISLFLLGLYFLMRGLRLKPIKGLRRFLIYMVPSMLLSFFLVYGLKAAVQMPRPCIPCPAELCNPYCDQGYSFPSGHAAALLTVYTSWFLSMRRRKGWMLAGYAVPLLVALSRIALGVHTYLDVFVGAAIGIASPVLVWYVINRIGPVSLDDGPAYRFRKK